MPKVIFIGGTNHSGSTMLDLMLGNCKHCFACGEIYAYFRPWSDHHHNPTCACKGGDNCNLWSKVKELGGEEELYSIISQQWNKEIISDSSKRISWFKDQQNWNASSDLEIKKILIFKHPLHYTYSYKKRNHSVHQCGKNWNDYNNNFLKAFPSTYVISYKDLATNPEATLKKACKVLGIKYFENKEKYWNKEHHLLFGGNAPKIHLHDKGSEHYNHQTSLRNDIVDGGFKNRRYRTIYYSDKWQNEISSETHKKIMTDEVKDTLKKLQEVKV